jgi:hypothetical protein
MEKGSAERSVAEPKVADPDGLAFAYEHVGGLEVPKVTWWKHRSLRKLYIMMPVLFLRSTFNGYDGSLLNGLQTMDPWQKCEFYPSSTRGTSDGLWLTGWIADFNHPSGSRLGLFTAIQNIGGVCALLFSSYAADLFGRRIGVCIGLLIVFVGTILQGKRYRGDA